MGNVPSLQRIYRRSRYSQTGTMTPSSGSSSDMETNSTASSSELNSPTFSEPEQRDPLQIEPAAKRSPIHNSCWTVYADTTATNPDLETTLKCIAHLVVKDIKFNHDAGNIHTGLIFEDDNTEPTDLPNDTGVFNFLELLFRVTELKADSAIIAFVYVHRLLQKTKIFLSVTNWRRVLLGGVVVASKVWDDHSWFNADICSVFYYMDADQLNRLERFYLSAMDFDLNIKPKVFMTCYFVLRDIAKESQLALDLDLPQFDKQQLRKNTQAYIQHVNSTDRNGHSASSNIMRRSKSDNAFTFKPQTFFVF